MPDAARMAAVTTFGDGEGAVVSTSCLRPISPVSTSPGGEVRIARQRREKGDVGDRAGDLGRLQRFRQRGERRRPVGRVHHQLGDHRIVEGRDGVAGPHARLDAHATIDGSGNFR